MLGSPKPRRLGEPISVSLDDLVPKTNFYRHLGARLDLGFVRAWFGEPCAERGSASIPLPAGVGVMLPCGGLLALARVPQGLSAVSG